MNKQEWLKHYRTNKKAIWINIKLTDGREFYHSNLKGWRDTKKICDDDKVFIEELSLQFRSHEVNIEIPEYTEALYLVGSVMGRMGGVSKNYYTTGILKDWTVYKKMWFIPELVVEKEIEDNLSDCFTEALIYDQREN